MGSDSGWDGVGARLLALSYSYYMYHIIPANRIAKRLSARVLSKLFHVAHL